MPRVRHDRKLSFNVSGLLASRIEKRVRAKTRRGAEYTISQFLTEACIAKLTDWEVADTPHMQRLCYMLTEECRRLEKQIAKLEDMIDERTHGIGYSDHVTPRGEAARVIECDSDRVD